MVTGWSKGGKTESVLAFLAHGARFVGDEWIYVEPDGSRVHGIPEPMRVWDWNLRQLPAARGRLSRGERARLGGLRAATGAARGRRGRRVAAFLDRQRYVDLPPERLFADGAFDLTAPFDRLFLVSSRDDPADGRPARGSRSRSPAGWRFSLEYEREPIAAAYAQFRFAFPDRRNRCSTPRAERDRALLERVFAGKPAFAVDHPYPVDLGRLFEVMDPLC